MFRLSFLKLFLIPVSIILFIPFSLAQDFDKEENIQVRGVLENATVKVKQRWELIWEKKACCGDKVSGRKYGYNTDLTEKELKIAKNFTNKVVMGVEPSPFNNRGRSIDGLVRELRERTTGGDDLIPEGLFRWTDEKDEKGKAEGNFAGLIMPGDKEHISFVSPECKCLTVKRYQLFVEYDLKGYGKIDHYVHHYKNDETVTNTLCDKPECKESNEANPTLPAESAYYDNGFPKDLEYQLFGTGKTTDEIINVVVHNPTNYPIQLPVTSVIFPRVNDNQAYEGQFPGDPTASAVTVEPGETDTIPAIGECLDVRKPPLGEGEPGPDISEVITPQNAPEFPIDPETLPPGFTRLNPTEQDLVIIYPGTDIPVPYTIDLGEGIVPASSLIFGIENALDTTFETLLENGAYDHLPLPLDRIVSEIPQLNKWYTYAILQGDPYTEEEFSERLDSQLVGQINMPVSSLAEQTQEEWKSGKTNIFSMVVFASKESKVVRENVFDIDHQETGPVFQDKSCDWRRICIDVFVMAKRNGNEYNLGQVYEQREWGGPRSRDVSVNSDLFELAGGALANVTSEARAASLVSNIRNMLLRVNAIYEPCCIWFEMENLYAIDPSLANVSTDETKLDQWVNLTRTDSDGEEDHAIFVEQSIRTANGNLKFLDAARRFVNHHSGLPENNCLKIFMGPSFEEAGDIAGKSDGESCSVFPQSNLNPTQSGFVPGHELGHNLRLEHDHSPENIMNERAPSIRSAAINISEEQCNKARERAEVIGENREPPTPQTPPIENEGGQTNEEGQNAQPTEPVPDPQEEANPPVAPDDEEENEEECECPDPEVNTTGLETLRTLEPDAQSIAESEVKSCCAEVKFSVELECIEESEYSLNWNLSYVITDPECFISFEIDRFYTSKRFSTWWISAFHPLEVPVSGLEFIPNPDGGFELRTDGGFQLDYSRVENMTQREQDIARDRFRPNEGINSLDRIESARSWQILIGGMMKCKDGDDIREIPFYFTFRRSRRTIGLNGDATILPESEILGSSARNGITTTSLYRNGQ